MQVESHYIIHQQRGEIKATFDPLVKIITPFRPNFSRPVSDERPFLDLSDDPCFI